MNEHETCDSLWWHMSRVNFAHSPQLGNASGLQTHQACRPTVHDVHDVHDVLCKTVWKVCHDSDIDSICITRQSMTKDWYWDFKWLRFRGLEVTYGWFDEHVCPPAPIHSIGVLPSRPESKRYLQLTWELDLPQPQHLRVNCENGNASCIFMLHGIQSTLHHTAMLGIHSFGAAHVQHCPTQSNTIKLKLRIPPNLKVYDLKKPKNGTWMNLEWDPQRLITQLLCYTEDPHWLQSHCPHEFSAFNAFVSLRSSSHSRRVHNVFGVHHFDQWD